MTPKIDYISIPASILTRKELSDKAKMLLGLIAGFKPKALMLSNAQIAEVFCTTAKHISRVLSELQRNNCIEIQGGRTRWRKVYFRNNGQVDTEALPQNSDSHPHLREILPHFGGYTSAKMQNKIKGTKESKVTQERVDRLFEQFWQRYPKKVSKAQAHKAFSKLNPEDALLDTMLDAIDRQRYTEQWSRNDGQFIPYPATWLAGRRWEDQIEESSTGCCMTREMTEEEADDLFRRAGLIK